MKLKEIRSRSEAELREDVERLRRELFNLRAQAVTSPVEDTTRFRKSRKTVARILTVLAERARAAGKPAQPVAAPKAEKALKKPVAKAEKPAKAEKAEKPKKAEPAKTEKKAEKKSEKKKGQKG